MDDHRQFAAWTAWREETEEAFCRLGEDLRAVVSHDEWKILSENERADRVERAHAFLRDRMDIRHETHVVWTNSCDKGMGYDQTTGEVSVSRRHLQESAPEALVPNFVHEMRHAWQWDVIQGRTRHPLGEVGRTELAEGLKRYTSDGPQYFTNSLEADAGDAAAAVYAGHTAAEGED